jgi:DNA (cytosine-5)-methyltransferase 1
MVYYNEFDPKAAAWLRQLIRNGDIARGVVDERSILDVSPPELEGFAQHHFFAGIGVWSYALRGAGWSDDRPVCTASLPCQPFSVAGNQKGKDDERHLLPHFLELVRECGFNIIFGEQVEKAIKHGWLDDLQTNMEREGYAVGHVVLGAHSVNAAHQRHRLYWVANRRLHNSSDSGHRNQKYGKHEEKNGAKISNGEEVIKSRLPGGTGTNVHSAKRVGDSNRERLQRYGRSEQVNGSKGREAEERYLSKTKLYQNASEVNWIYCRDGKYRPVKSGIEPLVDGLTRGMVYRGGPIYPDNTGLARVIRLKGYGNAINADVAREFIETFMEVTKGENKIS